MPLFRWQTCQHMVCSRHGLMLQTLAKPHEPMPVCCAGVLEVLNSLLSSGEVPGLFTAEELSKELASLDSKRDKDPHYQVQHCIIDHEVCTHCLETACMGCQSLSNLHVLAVKSAP
jgi:hypothetical protein